jgi:hypothetical protein
MTEMKTKKLADCLHSAAEPANKVIKKYLKSTAAAAAASSSINQSLQNC